VAAFPHSPPTSTCGGISTRRILEAVGRIEANRQRESPIQSQRSPVNDTGLQLSSSGNDLVDRLRAADDAVTLMRKNALDAALTRARGEVKDFL